MIKVKKHRSLKHVRRVENAATYIILIIISAIWLIPFAYLLLHSFRAEPGAYVPYIIPKSFTFDNYIKLFKNEEPFKFMTWYLNTFIVALVTAVIQTIMVLMVSYAFSRLRFKFRKGYMKLILLLGMFPGFMSMIAIYQVLKLVGLNQSIFSLIIVYCGSSAMQYYISKGFFDTIPYSLDEAAKIDGANERTIFFRVIMPLAKPIVIYTLLMAFTAPWGDYMFASYIANGDANKFNVAVGLYTFLTDKNRYEWFTSFCAGAVLVSIPITVLFFVLQRYYVEGVTGGAVKG
ncbi:MAG: sugar ABC transporter permease [Acholeplasmatales bacterium]|nr:sugar ABC transporter permease [Acholeplasmatales bacterium]